MRPGCTSRPGRRKTSGWRSRRNVHELRPGGGGRASPLGDLMAERRERDPDCLFCRIVGGEVSSDRVFEDEALVAFRDIAPLAPTHILLVPREHIPSARELTEDDGPLLALLFVIAQRLAAEEGIAD